MEEFFWHLNSQSWASMRGPYFLIRFKLNFKVSQPSITRYVDFVSCILAKNPQALLYIFAMRLHRRCLTGSQIHLWAAWTRTSFNSQAIWLKIPGSDLTRKVENKCMNVCERVEVVGRNKESPLPSRCPMNYQGLKKFWQKSFPSFLPWQAILFDFKHEYSKNYFKTICYEIKLLQLIATVLPWFSYCFTFLTQEEKNNTTLNTQATFLNWLFLLGLITFKK